jgi:cysteine desulfurase/selenocysteine lyase
MPQGQQRLQARRADFPALRQTVHGRPLIYLDHASTSQKPQVVLDRLLSAYVERCGNVHRAVHWLSQAATRDMEAVRDKVRGLLGAPSRDEVIFTRGTTESVNLVAHCLGGQRIGPGDEVVVTTLEHHSNFVPWQVLCQTRGARLMVAPLSPTGQLDLDALGRLLSPRTRLVACTHASNVTGTVVDVRAVCRLAQQVGALTLIDGAQAVPHLPVDVQALGCDFYCFSGHKLLGPWGVGVLWGRSELLATMPPWQTGGGMVMTVRADQTEFQPPPQRFEAGTPAVAEIIALGAAIDYLREVGIEAIAQQEAWLLAETLPRLRAVDGLRLLVAEGPQVPVISFVMDGVHPHDLGTALDLEGIAVRAGLHCAEPLFSALGVPGSVRASLSFYNTIEEVDALCAAIRQASKLLR